MLVCSMAAFAVQNGDSAYKQRGHTYVEHQLVPLTEGRLPELRSLTSHLFPVRYPDAFYSHALSADSDLTRLVYDGARLVAALCCGLDPESSCGVYIFTLGVLAPYREQGIGKQLLQHAVNTTKAMGRKRLFAHVQQSNEDAIRLYTKFGFVVKKTVHNYYKRIDPPHAVLIELVFG